MPFQAKDLQNQQQLIQKIQIVQSLNSNTPKDELS